MNTRNEQIDRVLDSIKKIKESKLTPRQQNLKNFLEDNFVSGKWWTIEEIVKKFVDGEGNPYYKLNTNPYAHDKCLALSQDAKQLNWHTGRERYIPIIKDTKGSIKLCENKEELETYVNSEKARIEKTYQYYNHLESLIELEGTIPFINLANRVKDDDELKPIEIYQKETRPNEEV